MEQDTRKEHRAVLLRAEYPYGKSQTWLPTDLHKVATKLDSAGINTDVIDLNLEPMPSNLQIFFHQSLTGGVNNLFDLDSTLS